MPQQKALECYIQELCEIDPEWEEKYAVKIGRAHV